MKQESKNRVVKCLKDARIQGGGQTFHTLLTVADIDHAFKHELSKFLQELNQVKKVTYSPTTKMWYWVDEITIDYMT